MPEINIRYVTDEKDIEYYPITHMDAIEGLDISNLEDLTNIKEEIDDMWDQNNSTSGQLSGIQTQIANLQSSLNSMVVDTGWRDIELLNGAIPYGATSKPQVRMVTIQGVSFITLKGAIKGLTSNNIDIGKIPSEMSIMVKENKSFAQNMSVSGGIAQFTRMSLQSSGIIRLERATLTTITEGQWFPIDITIMI